MTRELRIIAAGAAGAVGTGEPGGLDPQVLARVRIAVRLATLEDVLGFAFAQRPPWDIAEVIVQDEYTHDVVVRGPAPVFLVFDTT